LLDSVTGFFGGNHAAFIGRSSFAVSGCGWLPG